MEEMENTKRVQNPDSKNKKKKRISAKLLWCLLLVSSAVFFYFFYNMQMFPRKWSYFLAGYLALLLLVTGILSFKAKYKNIGIRIANFLLSAAMIAASVYMPRLQTQVTEVIEENNDVTKNTVKVNLYVLTDEYKQLHEDIFPDWQADVYVPPVVEEPEVIEEPEEKPNPIVEFFKNLFNKEPEPEVVEEPVEEEPEGPDPLADELRTIYTDKVFITQISVDTVYQQQTVQALQDILERDDFALIDRNSILEAASSLYNNEGQVLVMTSAYASMVENSDGFDTFLEDTRILYTVELPEEVNEIKLSNAELTTKPFSVFFGGNDEEGELNLSGRTDVDMIVTVNPNTHQIVITSFPRDSFVPNPALWYAGDKLTHLGVNGLDNTLAGISNLLETEIENYVIINFTTYRYIIDALGGVDVDNPYAFDADDGRFFDEGVIHLEGDPALMYVRERHHLPDGDFGRNMHQQLVMKAIINKVASPAIISHFESLLQALKGTFLTNISSDAIYEFCKKQLDENIHWNIVSYRVEGAFAMSACASAGSVELSVVLPYMNQLDIMIQAVRDVYAGNIIEQQEMPEGYGILINPVPGIPYEEVYGGGVTYVEETPAEEPAPEETVYEEPAPEETPVEEPVPEETAVEEPAPEEQPVAEDTPPAEEAPAEEAPAEGGEG